MASSQSEYPYEISSAITDDDHGPVIEVAAAICLMFSVFFMIIRGWIRWPWAGLAGPDDWSTLVATILGTVQTAIVISSVSQGFGKTQDQLNSDQLTSIGKSIYASDLFFVFTTWTTRLSVAFLFLRLTSSKDKSYRMYQYLTGGVGIFAVASVFATAIRETPSAPWNHTLSPGTQNRWIANGVMAILVEAALCITAILVVWNLQMPRKAKLNVVSGFAMRLPVVVFIAVRLVYLSFAADDTERGFTYAAILPQFLTQLELHYSIICATVPCLRIFLRSFNTGFHVMNLDQMDPSASRSGTRTKGESINMSTLRSMNGGKFGADGRGATTSKATHEVAADGESLDSDRSDRGIFVKQTINVERERVDQ